MLKTVEDALEPACRHSASRREHQLTDVIDLLGGMGKIEDAHRIGTVVIH